MLCVLCSTTCDIFATLSCNTAHHGCLDCLKDDAYGKKCLICDKRIRGIKIHESEIQTSSLAVLDALKAVETLMIRKDRKERPLYHISSVSVLTGVVLLTPVACAAALAVGAVAVAMAPIAVVAHGVVCVVDSVKEKRAKKRAKKIDAMEAALQEEVRETNTALISLVGKIDDIITLQANGMQAGAVPTVSPIDATTKLSNDIDSAMERVTRLRAGIRDLTNEAPIVNSDRPDRSVSNDIDSAMERVTRLRAGIRDLTNEAPIVNSDRPVKLVLSNEQQRSTDEQSKAIENKPITKYKTLAERAIELAEAKIAQEQQEGIDDLVRDSAMIRRGLEVDL